MPSSAENTDTDNATGHEDATGRGTATATAAPAARATRPRSRTPKLDTVAAEAVDLAREALREVTEDGQIGEHVRAEASGDRLVTHVFACTMPGYRGWSWVVVLARAPRAKIATVAETALLPGSDAVLAPEWQPWAERLRPSDVGADDLLPFTEFDERLEQGYEQTDDEEADRVAQWELGLGRPRVLSPAGRAEAAERWVGGDFGPRESSSRKRRGTISAHCASCGFLSQLSGSLRGEFGVCTNEWSPADGRVVHLQYGCGAHSETGQDVTGSEVVKAEGIVVDELDVEFVPDPAGESETATAQDDVRVVEPAASSTAAAGPADAAAAPADVAPSEQQQSEA